MQAAIEATKVAVQTMTEATGPTRKSNGAATDRWTILKQPTFDWKAQNKYPELLNLEIEEKKCHDQNYNITDSEKVLVIMNWLGCKGLHFMQTEEDQEICKSSASLSTIFNAKFKQQYNWTILSKQYFTFSREK